MGLNYFLDTHYSQGIWNWPHTFFCIQQFLPNVEKLVTRFQAFFNFQKIKCTKDLFVIASLILQDGWSLKALSSHVENVFKIFFKLWNKSPNCLWWPSGVSSQQYWWPVHQIPRSPQTITRKPTTISRYSNNRMPGDTCALSYIWLLPCAIVYLWSLLFCVSFHICM